MVLKLDMRKLHLSQGSYIYGINGTISKEN